MLLLHVTLFGAKITRAIGFEDLPKEIRHHLLYLSHQTSTKEPILCSALHQKLARL